ncbi:MAG: response regulator [Bacteroidota bacterium]|nr:response regulator [Bacteroidota bacterium]
MIVESPAKILIVDDHLPNLFALEVILDKTNYELVRATSGREALKILMKEADFALILIDALMPIMDGFDTATMIRQSQKLKYIPIIFLTAQMNEPDNILKGFEAGAVDYMLKPLHPVILKAKVAVFVELYRKNKETLKLVEEKNNAERAKLVAEDAAKSKQQFLANMSHEIRTPMTAIIGFTQVLLKTDLSENQNEYLQIIKRSGHALLVLINDILDLAKVDAGKMTFEQIPFKMEFFMSNMLKMFDIKIQEKNLELVKEYDNKIPEILIGDAVRLHQILLNLLSNALKFTAKGKITVAVRLLNEDKEKATIEVAITDTGTGIPEDKLESIFENFQQATSSTSRIFGGTGLGLAICKQLIEKLGGTISVKSKVEEGSTFSFTLIFQKTNGESKKENEEVELGREIKDIKILVVEDVKLNQLLMRLILDDFKFKYDIADNGKIAIEKLQTETYDIILMDLQMPEMNGLEATEYIRNTMNSKIPIIALTADVTTVDVEKCKAVGMTDYVSKPIDERILYSKIVELLKS